MSFNPLDLTSWAGKAVAVGAVLTVGIAIYGAGYYKGKVRTEAKHAAAELVAERQRADASRKLIQDINDIRRTYDQAAKDNADAVATLLDSLRKRPSRSQLPGPGAGPRVSVGCTGADLYREDAEAFARYAAETGIIADALGQCQDETKRLRARMRNPLATQ